MKRYGGGGIAPPFDDDDDDINNLIQFNSLFIYVLTQQP
jgi:hypothetical protein